MIQRIKCDLNFNNELLLISGTYECKLIRGTDSASFRQTYDKFNVTAKPVIKVSPVKINVECFLGNSVTLNCSVDSSTYNVEFKDQPAAGKTKTNKQTTDQLL